MKLLAPVTSCDKVLCIGMNYKDHCEEQNAPVPVEPVIFNKFPSCIIGPDDMLSYPKESKVSIVYPVETEVFVQINIVSPIFETLYYES